MKKIGLLAIILLIGAWGCAVNKTATVTTSIEYEQDADKAKLAHLRPQVNGLISLVNAKRFAEAEDLAKDLRKSYEAEFDTRVKQYTFRSQKEFDEFKKTADSEFEWIDWGYMECLQNTAFLQSERKNFPGTVETLEYIQRLAPMSASTLIEMGYALNQMGTHAKALSSYQKAQTLSLKYTSQSLFRAPALRGIGYTLIELQRLDEAEQAYKESLKIDPQNRLALRELAYIEQQRKSK